MFSILKRNLLAEDRHYFLFLSRGHTATLWIATVLNRHPEIFCSHGYSYPIYGAGEASSLSTDELILRSQASAKRMETIGLKGHLKELRDYTHKKVLGNTHAYCYGRILGYHQSHIKNVRLIQLIRHPINRVNSMWHHGIKHPLAPSDTYQQYKMHCGKIAKYISQSFPNIDLNQYKNFGFLLCIEQLNAVSSNLVNAHAHKLPVIKCEDMVTDPKVLKWIVSYISKETLTAEKNYIDQAYNTPIINKHSEMRQTSPKEIYESWEPWQQAAFSYVFHASKIGIAYSKEAYDFSFIV